MGDIIRGTPVEVGFVRSPEHDRLLKKRAGWEVWRTPERVLLALPPGCEQVGLIEIKTPRGTTLACVEPDGVESVWPFKRGEKHGENES